MFGGGGDGPQNFDDFTTKVKTKLISNRLYNITTPRPSDPAQH
jgi:hypothetical protein